MCISRQDGGEGQSVRACLTWAVGLAWWLGCDWMTVWVKPSLMQARQLILSLSLPGVTGWDIKTGILINCATLPPAALNMLRPRQAVCYISDSLVLFQLDLAHLSLPLSLLPLFFLLCLLSNFQISLIQGIPLQFDPNKWRLQPIDKVIPGLYDRISQFLLRTWRELISTCVLFHWPWNYPPCTPPHTLSCLSTLCDNSVLPNTHQPIH